MKKAMAGGESLSLQIQGKAFAKSAHNDIGCAGCHPNVDVAKHPRIFRESMARRKRQKKQKPPGGGGGGEIKIKRLESIDDFLLLHPLDLIGGEVEYVSQAEYRK